MDFAHTALNKPIVILSISILIFVCIFLLFFTFILSVAYRNMQQRLRDRGVKINNKHVYKHPLTGLGSRSEFINKLKDLLENDAGKQVNTAVMFVDVDDFNSINASVGIKIGDAILQTTGQRICYVLSKYSKLIYQIGSDEFVVILHDCGNDQENLGDIAQAVIDAVAAKNNIEGYELEVTCSVGVCLYPDCARDAEELLMHAGIAKDNAKQMGCGSYSFYTKEMSKESILRTLISADLRYALTRNELYLHYQPKVNITTGRVQGAEALLRWQHPSLGNISPEIFIPIMEDLGLIHAVGKWVFDTALKDISKVHKLGFDNINIAINVSPQQFNKGDVAGIIAESIWQTEVPPYKVELELTEALVMRDTEKTLLMLKVLQSMGVKIAVDDFGTGYSSMNHLTRFPISILKIDRSFIHEMPLSPVKIAIVSAIIKMSKQLGYEVVAEGVETKEELAVLQEEGCDLVQGFYYSKALPLDEFIKYLSAKNSINITAIDRSSGEQSA